MNKVSMCYILFSENSLFYLNSFYITLPLKRYPNLKHEKVNFRIISKQAIIQSLFFFLAKTKPPKAYQYQNQHNPIEIFTVSWL